MILISLFGVFKSLTPPTAQELQMQEMMQEMNPDADMSAMTNRSVPSAISGLLFQVLALVGIVMMWKLKKIGFYLYALAELLPYPVSIFSSGMKGLTSALGMLGENFEAIIYIVLALVVVIDLLFIFLYSRNLKYMS